MYSSAVCVCMYTRMQRFSATRVHIGYLDRKIFSIFPRGVVHSICKRVSCISPGLRLLPTAAPVRATAKGRGWRRVQHEGRWTTRVKKIVDRSRRIRDRIHGTTRVHATWFARCYEIIPLLLPLPLLSSFLFPSLSPSPRSTADFPATGFCLSALLSSLEKRTRGIRSLRRSGLIGTSLISRLWGPLLLLLPLPPSPPPWNLAWLMYTGFLLTSCNDEDAFVARKERSSVNLHSEPPVTFHPVRG